MKGVELPISTIVIVVIALVILLAILALFFGVWTPGSSGVSLEAAKNSACQILLSTGCGDTEKIYVNNFDADKDGEFDPNENVGDCNIPGGDSGDNLYMLCRCWYNEFVEEECKTRICNCS
jgi:hypothetical protein